MYVDHGHRNVRTWEWWEPAFNFDYLLVLGRTGVNLLDGEFFAGVLSVDPVLGERAEFLASLNIERAA